MSKLIKINNYLSGNIYYKIFDLGSGYGLEEGYYDTGEKWFEDPYFNNKMHGIQKFWTKSGKTETRYYWLYNEEVTKKEYKEHQLIEQLAGIK